jgi:hypothetical protein
MAVENDILLIYLEDDPVTFARVEEIKPDVKPDWYQIKLLFLQLPLQVVTWILRAAYIDGDTFTMNGKAIRLEKVVAPDATQPFENAKDAHQKDSGIPDRDEGKKVIYLADKKKR